LILSPVKSYLLSNIAYPANQWYSKKKMETTVCIWNFTSLAYVISTIKCLHALWNKTAIYAKSFVHVLPKEFWIILDGQYSHLILTIILLQTFNLRPTKQIWHIYIEEHLDYF